MNGRNSSTGLLLIRKLAMSFLVLVVPNKVRWARQGMGKRGGVRVVYFFLSQNGSVLLWSIYAKSDRANMTANEIINQR